MKDLTKGNTLRLILGFAFPLAVGNIFQIFYNLVDTRIVGSFLGEDALAAVGSTSSLNNMIIGFLMGMTNGFAIITARYFGAKDEKGLRKSAAAAFSMGIVISVLFTIVSVLCLRPVLAALQTPENLIGQAYQYFKIILIGMTGAMLYNVCAGLFRAVGDSVTPLLFLIASTGVNIGLDLLFVCVFHLGVEGAAAATVISQALSFLACFVYMQKKFVMLRFGWADLMPDRELMREMLTIGISMGFMNSLINIGSVVLQRAINSLNDASYIVAHTAARKITEIFMLPFGVFGSAMATFCGQNLGAGKTERIRRGLREVILITWAWCALTVLLSYTAVPYLVELITATKNKGIIDTASLYLQMDTMLYFVTAVICILRNAMQGIGDSVTPIISSFLELLCKFLVAVFLTPYWGYWAIIWSEPVSWVIMIIPLLVNAYRNPVLHYRRRQADSV
ncbi:MAG: MATE family efflux transporter [Lachnospiraceae bacterium]|nr:MATE family efflux transporter [Lachnospiraceae bacterium]